MSDAVGTGHFVSWDGGCLLIGRADGGRADARPLRDPDRLRRASRASASARATRAVDGVRRRRHPVAAAALDGRDARAANVVLFVEPETREGRALAERFRQSGIAALPARGARRCRAAAVRGVAGASAAQAAIADAAQARRSSALTGGVEPPVVSDERILRAMAYIRAISTRR